MGAVITIDLDIAKSVFQVQLAAPFRSLAQQQGKVWRVGVLSIGSANSS